MAGLPDDIKRAAEKAYAERDQDKTVLFAIAAGITAERRRCAEIASNYEGRGRTSGIMIAARILGEQP